MDLAVAAASAAGETVALPPRRSAPRGRGRSGRGRDRAAPPPPLANDDDLLHYDEAKDLPDVDDLDVAAAAAAATQEALARAAAAPLYQVPRVVPAPVAMDTDTEEEEGEEREEGEEEGVMVVMEVVEEGQGGHHVRVHLLPTDAGGADDDDTSDDEGDAIGGPDDLRAMIDALEADDGEGEEEGERGADALGLPPPAAFDVDITPDDAVTEVGKIASLVEGMLVVQTSPGATTLAEGSVLCLADRTPLGRVEDVFGPVVLPFYALRHYSGGVPPPNVTCGVSVFSVDRYAKTLVPTKLKSKGYDAADADPGDPDETKFSDDEEEAAHLQREQMEAKARAQATASQFSQGRGSRSGRGRGGRSSLGRGGGRGRGPPTGPPAGPGYGGGHAMPAAGAPWPYGPYGHYPVPYAVAAQYAATGYAPGGAPLAGWGAPASAPPPGWQQQQQPGWGGQQQQ